MFKQRLGESGILCLLRHGKSGQFKRVHTLINFEANFHDFSEMSNE